MGIQMDYKTLTIFFLVLAISWGQDKAYQNFDWKPVKIQRQSSVHPYSSEATTTSYDSRYFEQPIPYQGSTGYYPDNPSSFHGAPEPYSPDSYSPDFANKGQLYQYPDDSGSYEQYGYTRDDNFNITKERYGGFGGTGDTRGFGAYDYPKKVVDDVPQGLHPSQHADDRSFPDLLRIGRERTYYRRNPMPVHPLPPPL